MTFDTILALPLNWIPSKIISAATFRIIGLIKLAKIEFLPLDWIYRSIRIMTVDECRALWGEPEQAVCQGLQLRMHSLYTYLTRF